MIRRITFSPLLCSLTAAGLFALNPAIASGATISSSNIALPELDGFSLLSLESPGVHPVASRLLEECSKELCAVYAGEAAIDDQAPVTWANLPPFFQFQIMDDELVVTANQFVAIKEALKADIEGLRAKVVASIAATPFDVNVLSPEGAKLVFVEAPIQITGEVFESESYLAVPVSGSNKYRQADGSIVSYTFDVTFGFIHARDKIALTMLFGPEKGPDWGRKTFEYIVSELRQANQ